MERKVTKKIGSCKCNEYREEIKELTDIISDLKSQLKKYEIPEPEPPYTLPNSFSEFNAQMDELNDFDKEPCEFKENLDFNEFKEFNIDEFNKEFEAKKATQKYEEEPILFKTTNKNEIDYKKDYNPNILPEKSVSGFEKFDLDAFNKQFEQQNNNVNHDVTSEISNESGDTIEEAIINYKKNYNPNILPQKAVSGFEKFDINEFNKQFEQQTTVNYNGI